MNILKTILIALALSTASTPLWAEDILQVQPFHTAAGVVSDDAASFSIVMNNTSAEIWAFQFDIRLPGGMTLDTAYEPFELNTERYPYSKDRKGNIIYQHSIVYEEQADGWWRVIVHTDNESRLSGERGEVLTAYFTTATDMPAGVYPIYIKNALLVIDGSHGIYPEASTSYVVVGDAPCLTQAKADFSCLTGYVPSFVVEGINSDLAANTALTSIDLSGAKTLGADLFLPNTNALIQASEGTDIAALPNAVAGGQCDNLALHDGAGDFASNTAFTAAKASFDRQYPASWWQTVCLPFALDEAQTQRVKDRGVEIEALKGYDASAQSLRFEPVLHMESATPYIVRCTAPTVAFEDLENVSVVSTAQTPISEADGVRFEGTFAKRTVSSNESVTYYAYNSQNGEFVRIGKNATVPAFRALIALETPVGGSAPALRIAHGGEGSPTSINQPATLDAKTPTAYDLQGRRVNQRNTKNNIIITNGKKIMQ